jgi:hypothetical protein
MKKLFLVTVLFLLLIPGSAVLGSGLPLPRPIRPEVIRSAFTQSSSISFDWNEEEVLQVRRKQ